MTRLINERQAAHMLGCSIFKMQRDRRIGSPIPYIKLGRAIRYNIDDIEAYIKAHQFTSTSQYPKPAKNPMSEIIRQKIMGVATTD